MPKKAVEEERGKKVKIYLLESLYFSLFIIAENCNNDTFNKIFKHNMIQYQTVIWYNDIGVLMTWKNGCTVWTRKSSIENSNM